MFDGTSEKFFWRKFDAPGSGYSCIFLMGVFLYLAWEILGDFWWVFIMVKLGLSCILLDLVNTISVFTSSVWVHNISMLATTFLFGFINTFLC